ncbi:PP2C-domain-containing protein [Aspergillus japonicus CBS 114.51]|uniref:PP2C-domain-containing protein n=2 Tax=Aspergillus TaxID=5052 RepID=A0A2V5I0M9_ASPV1|nr:PP2C-domain-containing protein [Aspergillus japonicus CBS 114.51]PYI17657.1 PP2C-domain-containing protein [Aspergillus violaceofuscus CBS 115571]RAH76992.1 PP2C-domain-containing protein [Aspergillus japonicus CBS 114.51]
MFSGSSSPPKDRSDTTIARSGAIDTPPLSIRTEDSSVTPKKFSPPGGFFTRRTSEDQGPGSEKKRRSSTVTKAASFFTSAKNSFSLSSSPRENSFNNYTIQEQPGLAKFGSMDPALSVPQGSLNNSAGESHPTARSSFRVGVTEDRNRKCRRTMEDTHAYLYNFLGTPALSAQGETGTKAIAIPTGTSPTSEKSTSVVETDNGYFAIFDGHAGTFAAEWCGKKLHLILEDVMRKNPSTPVPELLDQTFTSVDQQLEKLPLKNSGCTAVIALLRWEDRVPSSHSATGSSALASAAAAAAKADTDSDEAGDTPTQAAVSGALPKLQEKAARQRVLYTANVGDARIILCRNGKALRLSYDHKGSDENEGKRIANAGGLILNNRVNGVLAVTRALGDAYLKDLVTGHPYTTETVIQPESDEFIILACDGLWDVCSDQEAVDLIRNVPDAQEASKILVDHALARFSTDNLSCMVIRFDTERVKDVVNRTAEPIGVEGDQETEHGVSEADKIVESARKSMAKAGITDNPEKAEKVQEEILEKMANERPEPAPPAKEDNAAAIADKLKVPEPRNPTA